MNKPFARVLILLVMLCLSSCTNNKPLVEELITNTNTGYAPLGVEFSWRGINTDNSPVSCVLDTNDDGKPEFTAFDCSSLATKTFLYLVPGSFVARLTVMDAIGTSESRTQSILVNNTGSASAFNISLRFSANFPAIYKPNFEAAARRWETIIAADIPDSNQVFTTSNCVKSDVTGVDDLVIFVDTLAFDKNNPNVLGQAGPCFVRLPTYFTLIGKMQFVEQKIAGLQAKDQLTSTILHEMGHILGIGTNWAKLPNVAIGLSSDPNKCGITPQFVGVNALREYHDLGGVGNIAIENTGGLGTCDGHWKESVFNSELMTGIINNPNPQNPTAISNPLSRITLGSMQDLGYNIDLSKADLYSIPVTKSATRATNTDTVTRPEIQYITEK